MVVAARRVSKGRRRWGWVFVAPGLVGLSSGVWVAIRTWPDQPLLAILLGLISVPSLLLFIRMARQQVSDVPPSDPSWRLSSTHFDYIVWMAIGLPFLAILGLLVVVAASALGFLK